MLALPVAHGDTAGAADAGVRHRPTTRDFIAGVQNHYSLLKPALTILVINSRGHEIKSCQDFDFAM